MGILTLLTNPPKDFKFYIDKGYVGNGETSGMKSYRFGQDRPGGGSSNQPYVQKPIQNDIKNPSFYNDFILRGGILAPISAANDVVRLSKYFIDLQNPNGILFTAKQNLLSRIGTKTESSKGLGYAGGALNEGAYTPLSTLAEAGVIFAGGHVNKQGLDPTGLFSGASINKYQDIISQNQFNGSYDVTFSDDGTLPDPKYVENNRLTKLTTIIPPNIGVNNFTFVKGYSLNPSLENDVLISYGGGPNSVLGIGKTNIKFATDNNGIPIKTLKPSFNPKTYLVGKPFSDIEQNKFQIPIGLTTSYEKSFNLLSPIVPNDLVKDNLPYYQESVQTNVYESGLLENTDIIGKGSWTQKDFVNQPPNPNNEITEDFRKILNPSQSPQNTFLSLSPSYKKYMMESDPSSTSANSTGYGRIGLRSPGQKGDRSNYIFGKKNLLGEYKPVDFINALPIYKSTSVTSKNEYKNDLIKFRIAILDNDTQEKYFIHFRAFLNSFSDSYGADWKSLEYMGRGEKFFKYSGFSRDISLSFTVAALSKQELIPMYKKLNFLASSLAPSYSSKGYLRGNIAYLTVGAYCFELPGVINSLDYDIPKEASWEIAISLKDNAGNGVGSQFDDDTVREVPHMIEVTMKFTPIHTFRPEIMSITPKKNQGIFNNPDPLKDRNIYGDQRFISLENPYNSIKSTPNEIIVTSKKEAVVAYSDGSEIPIKSLVNENTMNYTTHTSLFNENTMNPTTKPLVGDNNFNPDVVLGNPGDLVF